MKAHHWIGLDAGDEDLDRAEQAAVALADALGCVDEVCTHALALARPHYAATLRIPAGSWAPTGIDELRRLAEGAIVLEGGEWALETGDADGRAGARAAIFAHSSGAGGRAVRFLGQERLGGAMTVDEVLAKSAIAEVRVLGGELRGGMVLETRGYVRPVYAAGALSLLATPLEDGRLQPFELEQVHHCCGDH